MGKRLRLNLGEPRIGEQNFTFHNSCFFLPASALLLKDQKPKPVHKLFFIFLILKKQQTVLMKNTCDYLHWYEISVVSILLTFKVDQSIFYWSFFLKKVLLIPRKSFRSIIHRKCKYLQHTAQGNFTHWIHCETSTQVKRNRFCPGPSMFLMLSSSCYLRAALLLLPECSHSVTLTVLIILDRHTFMPLVYIYSLNPENNPMKNYYYCPHIKDEETRELSVCVICQGHNAINSRAGIQCHEPWLLLRGFESPRTLLSLVLSSYDFHSNRNLEAGNLHRTRAAVWLVSELEGLKVCIRDEWFSKAGPGPGPAPGRCQDWPVNSICHQLPSRTWLLPTGICTDHSFLVV